MNDSVKEIATGHRSGFSRAGCFIPRPSLAVNHLFLICILYSRKSVTKDAKDGEHDTVPV